MRRRDAKAIMAGLGKLDVAIGEIDTACRRLPESERNELLTALFGLMRDSQEKIMFSVVRQYPELHPYK